MKHFANSRHWKFGLCEIFAEFRFLKSPQCNLQVIVSCLHFVQLVGNDVQRSETGIYIGTPGWEPIKHLMGIPPFTVCIDMNILETSLDEGHLYFY